MIRGYLSALLEAFGSLPGATFATDGGVARSATPIAWPFFNGLLAGPGADPATVDAALATLPRPFFLWELEDTPPEVLAQGVVAGLRPFSEREPWMSAHIDELPEVAPPDGVTIEEVGDLEPYREWARTMGAVYDFPAAGVEGWTKPAELVGGADLPWRCWIARIDGVPVGTSMVFTGGGVAGLYGVGTAASARRRGIGRLLTVHPLRQSDAEFAGLFASVEGAALYRTLGFREDGWVTRHLAR